MGAKVEHIREKIQSFKRRYYLNIFLRGLILSLSIILSYFLLVTLLEHALWLSSWARLLLFITFFGIVGFCVFRFLKEPLQWWVAKRGITEEESAKVIGSFLPAVSDRLLNLLQLSSANYSTSLASASIDQKAKEFESISFEGFIDLRENKQYLKFLFLPGFIVLGILFFNRQLITESTERIFHFNRQYSPQAPFEFIIVNQTLTAFYSEDFTLNVKLEGNALPENAYIVIGNQRLKLEKLSAGDFSITFDNLQRAFDFQLEAAGFYSTLFKVNLISRPELTQFNATLEYPRYLQRKSEKLSNVGNLEVPEGTTVRWSLNTQNTKSASIKFTSDNTSNNLQYDGNQLFSYSKEFRNPDGYEIALENDESSNKDKITYQINVIKDEFPSIVVNHYNDSVLFKRVILSGMIGDDHGVSKLALHFRVKNEKDVEILSKAIPLNISKSQLQQSFFYNWSLDSVKLNPGDQLDYYLEVWDNDGVNGSKSTKTARYNFMVPSAENLVAEIKQTQQKTEQRIDQSVGKANKLQDKIEEASQKLKGKRNLDWQDKKMLEDILEQKNSLDQAIEQLKEQNKLLEEKKDAFTEQDERIREKAAQIQKLMDELLDEETRKLFEELQKMLDNNKVITDIQKLLDKLNQNTNNLEKELERTLELFKQLQFDYKLDQAIQELKDQIENLQSLLEKTEQLDQSKEENQKKGKKNDKGDADKENDENQKSESENLASDQEELKEDFKQTAERIEELKKLSEELKKPDNLPNEKSSNEVEQAQEESEEMLQQNNPAKAKEAQQKALQQMQKMMQQMEGAQSSMSMEMDMQNLESLRQIIHGLVKLSFDQENILKSFGELNQNDPRFNLLAQQQLKLKDDVKVLEDSLLSLGKRDPFMGPVVTKEVGELKNQLEKVIDANRERRRPQASSAMQASMTSINNLALMLDSHFDMMMQMMANAQPSMGKSKKKGEKPSLSQLQQQLNNKIQELKGSGKSGRELSEELAQMAAEQERIRKALQEMQEKMKDGKMPGGNIPGSMEQTEMDLVNKKLTDQLIKRQQDILTRLLETEKSMREQDMDEERKGEGAKDYENEIPKAFEEYLRLREKEVELLKTVPPKLYPYYKKEVSEYFKRMGNQ